MNRVPTLARNASSIALASASVLEFPRPDARISTYPPSAEAKHDINRIMNAVKSSLFMATTQLLTLFPEELDGYYSGYDKYSTDSDSRTIATSKKHEEYLDEICCEAFSC